MKIRSVGLNLSGGKGLEKFLKDAGFSTHFFYSPESMVKGKYSETIHGARHFLDHLEESYDAIIDFPCSFAYEHAYNKDNSTKFIYIKNDLNSWVESFKNTQTLLSHEKVYIFEEFFCNFYDATEKNKMQDLTEEELVSIYTKHDAAVTSFFANNPNFLMVELNDPQITSKLKEFLSIDLDIEFNDILIA
jgi:hypothetical protein